MVRDLIAADHEHEHRVWTVGPRELSAAAERAGLAVDEHLPAAAGRFWPAWWTLHRRVRGWGGGGGRSGATDKRSPRSLSVPSVPVRSPRTSPQNRPSQLPTRPPHPLPSFDRIHAWSLSGAALAGAAMKSTPRIATITPPPTRELSNRWLRRLLRRRPALLFAADRPTQRALLAHRMGPTRAALTEPAIDTRWLGDAAERRSLRMSWGVADRATRIVVAVGDPPQRIDAMTVALAAGLTAEAGRPIRLLISPRAANLPRARRVMSATGRPHLIIADERADRPWEVLHGCDIALALAGGPSLAWAMAAGCPLIAPDRPPMNDWLADDRTALLSPSGSAGELARRVCRLSDNTETAARLAAAAQREAEARFDITRRRRMSDEG